MCHILWNHVWFTGNGIGDEGAKQLAESLANNDTLTSLDLRGTRWCSVTPASIVTANPVNSNLKYNDRSDPAYIPN